MRQAKENKFRGLLKIGSMTAPILLACTKRARALSTANHGRTGCSGDGERKAERDEPQKRLDLAASPVVHR